MAGHPERAEGAKGVSRSLDVGRPAVAMWYVYFLRLANGDVYVGSTNDLRRRVGDHSSGNVISTRRYLPVSLLSYIAVPTEAHARKLERYFKSGSGKAFAKKRLLHDSEQAPPLAPRGLAP